MATDPPPLEMTAEMLGTALKIPKDRAYGLMKFGEDMGWIKKIGNMPAPSARGRGATIYAVPANLGELLATMWNNRRSV